MRNLAGTDFGSFSDQEILTLLAGLSDDPDSDEADDGIGEVIRTIAEGRATIRVIDWQRAQAYDVQVLRTQMGAFEARPAGNQWRVALVALDAMHSRAAQSCEQHYLAHQQDAPASDEPAGRWEALVRVHRRALMVSSTSPNG